MARWADLDNVIITMMVVVVVMMAILMREVHKCGQVCFFIEVGQVASNWETPRGSYSQIRLTKIWNVAIKPIVLYFSISFLQPKSKTTHHEI